MTFEPITDPERVKECYDALQESVGEENLFDEDRTLGVRY